MESIACFRRIFVQILLKFFYFIATFMITDQIWSYQLDGLIKMQISEWQEYYNMLDKDGDGNGLISIDEFAAGHQNIMELIGNQFFDGKKEINFDQYCLYMMLFSDQDRCYEINEKRIKKLYNYYCKMRKPEFNGRIKIFDFLGINNDLLTIEQFEDILQCLSNSLSLDIIPGEINYEQFKEFVESMITFALMDRDHNRSI